MRIIRILATLMLLVMMGAPAVAHDSAEDQKIVTPGEPEGFVLVADYMNTPTCEEPTVLAGSVTTTTTWAFDRITWTWVSTVNVVDTREEVSLTAAESEACNPVMPPETPPSIAPPAIQSPTAPPATLVHVTPLFAG